MSHPVNDEILETLYEEELNRISFIMTEECVPQKQIEEAAVCYAKIRFEEMS